MKPSNPQSNAGSGASNPPQTGNPGGSRRMIIYLVVALIAIVIVILIVAMLTSPGSPSITTITQNRSTNSTEVYMSPSQMQTLINSSLSQYNKSDLYSPSSYINMSLFTTFVPQLQGNATSGWISSGMGSNAATNATITFLEITTANTASIAKLLGAYLISSINDTTPTTVNSGSHGGMNYTFGAYSNSTFSYQILYGWKGDHAVVVLAEGNPGFMVNETQLVGITANDTP